MKFGEVSLDEAAGKILAHSILDSDGHKIISKGHVLSAKDVDVLREQALASVVVAALEATDLTEDDGARRVSVSLAGEGVRVLARGAGRGTLIPTLSRPPRTN